MSRAADLNTLFAELQPVNLQAFTSLCSDRENNFLRESLTSAHFRQVQRGRARVALKYCCAIAQNTKRISQIVRVAADMAGGFDAELQRAAETAVRVRTHILVLQARL